MTAYSRVSKETEVGHFLIEIQSVNRKFLEINTFLPKDLLRFDADIKKWVNAALSRGQLNIRVSALLDQKQTLSVIPNLSLAREIKGAWDKIAIELGLDPQKSFDLRMLTEEKGILHFEEHLQDDDLYRICLHEGIQVALKNLLEMKLKEGTTLQQDILKRWTILLVAIQQIETKTPHAVQKYREKLINRLEEVLPGSIENEDKILREICLFAEKIDISEEVVRFHSHLEQFKEWLLSESTNHGKTLEFLIQELNREVNTIGSKSADVEITRLVVEIKTELERIREQIQNVE